MLLGQQLLSFLASYDRPPLSYAEVAWFET